MGNNIKLSINIYSTSDYFQKLIDGVENGKIFNVHYKDAMSVLNNRFETGWDSARDNPRTNEWRDYREKNHLPWDFFSPRLINTQSTIKQMEKFIKEHEVPVMFFQERLDYLKIFVPFKEINDTLKKNTIAGRVPNPNAVPKFEPTFSPNDAKIVESKFKEITASLRDNQIKSLVAYYVRVLNAFQNIIKDIPSSDPDKYRFNMGHGPRSPWTVYKGNMPDIMSVRDFVDMKKDWLPVDNVAQKIEAQATREIDIFLSSYIIKNVKKLSALVGKKPLKGIKTIRATAGSHTIDSELFFDFEDGSSFYVINKAVFVQNQAGTQFMRFPTTFHDVKMSDGTKMKMPSEEKMNKVWV
jgi:hypothetical protein